jgi:hypothetical protein
LPSQTSSTFGDHATFHSYDYCLSNSAAGQDGTHLQGQFAAGIPRTWPEPEYDTNLFCDSSLAPNTNEPSAYMIEPTRTESRTFGLPYESHDGSGDFSRLTISPKIEDDTFDNERSLLSNPTPRMRASENSDHSLPSSREMTAVEVEDHSIDEPYAKLIYRALTSRPDHAMVLQDIYQWFRENTTKGGSDTKGWMNSIRHNLSMNAVSSENYFQ